MAIKSVSGNSEQPTVYVIKGDGNAQNMAQFWSQLVSQQKYQLVNDAIKIAMTEETQRSKERMSEDKYNQQVQTRLAREITSLEKQKTNLITKEASMKQRLDIASTPSTSTTSGGGGRAGSKDPNAQQALAETKELRRLQRTKDDLQRDKADYDRNQALFETSNPAFAEAERKKATAAQSRINQIDNILSPGGVAADKNNNGMIDQSEIGRLLPTGSYETSGGKDGKGRTTTRAKKIDAEPADFSDRREELQDMIDSLEAEGRKLSEREVQRNPTILARAAEIAGRTDMGTPRDGEMPEVVGRNREIEQKMMGKYFPQDEFSLPQTDMTMEKPQPKGAFDSTKDKMYQDFKRDFVPQEEAPAEPFQMEDPNAPLNTSLDLEEAEAKPTTLRDRAEELKRRVMDIDIDIPSDIVGSNAAEQEADYQDNLRRMATIQTEQEADYQDNLARMEGISDGQPPITNSALLAPQMNQPPNDLQLYNQLLGEQPKPPQKEEGAFNTTGDNKLEEGKVLAAAVEGGRTKTKKEVRTQLANAEDTEWASVVTKLYSPAPQATANERIRLRDNAYQQLYKTYEDNPTVLADATEFLIALDALEMGALPSE